MRATKAKRNAIFILSLADAMEMYAKALRRRMGQDASIYARKRAAELRAGNDYEGEEIWRAVALRAESLRKEDCFLPTLGI